MCGLGSSDDMNDTVPPNRVVTWVTPLGGGWCSATGSTTLSDDDPAPKLGITRYQRIDALVPHLGDKSLFGARIRVVAPTGDTVNQ